MPERDHDRDSMAFSVTLRATSHGLGRLVSVLQTRGAEIVHLTWSLTPQHLDDRHAEVMAVVAVESGRQVHLRRAVARIVDVLDVSEQPKVG